MSLDIDGAEEALRALKQHHEACLDRCRLMGWGTPPRGLEKRCDEGTRLYDKYMSFCPPRISGERLPDSKEKVSVEEHVLGNITVWAYRVDASDGNSIRDWKEHGEVFHAVFLDGKQQRAGVKTLDDALVMALADKYSGNMSGAGYYACKVLGMPTEE